MVFEVPAELVTVIDYLTCAGIGRRQNIDLCRTHILYVSGFAIDADTHASKRRRQRIVRRYRRQDNDGCGCCEVGAVNTYPRTWRDASDSADRVCNSAGSNRRNRGRRGLQRHADA